MTRSVSARPDGRDPVTAHDGSAVGRITSRLVTRGREITRRPGTRRHVRQAMWMLAIAVIAFLAVSAFAEVLVLVPGAVLGLVHLAEAWGRDGSVDGVGFVVWCWTLLFAVLMLIWLCLRLRRWNSALDSERAEWPVVARARARRAATHAVVAHALGLDVTSVKSTPGRGVTSRVSIQSPRVLPPGELDWTLTVLRLAGHAACSQRGYQDHDLSNDLTRAVESAAAAVAQLPPHDPRASVSELLTNAGQTARLLLNEHAATIDYLASLVMERELLLADDLAMLEGMTIRLSPWQGSPPDTEDDPPSPRLGSCTPPGTESLTMHA